MKGRKLIYLVSMALFILAVIMAWKILDMSVTLTYYEDSFRQKNDIINIQKDIINGLLNGESRQIIEQFIRTEFSETYVVIKRENTIFINDVGLTFDNGKFVGISEP